MNDKKESNFGELEALDGTETGMHIKRLSRSIKVFSEMDYYNERIKHIPAYAQLNVAIEKAIQKFELDLRGEDEPF